MFKLDFLRVLFIYFILLHVFETHPLVVWPSGCKTVVLYVMSIGVKYMPSMKTCLVSYVILGESTALIVTREKGHTFLFSFVEENRCLCCKRK